MITIRATASEIFLSSASSCFSPMYLPLQPSSPFLFPESVHYGTIISRVPSENAQTWPQLSLTPALAITYYYDLPASTVWTPSPSGLGGSSMKGFAKIVRVWIGGPAQEPPTGILPVSWPMAMENDTFFREAHINDFACSNMQYPFQGLLLWIRLQ